jgi:hypothetical protein
MDEFMVPAKTPAIARALRVFADANGFDTPGDDYDVEKYPYFCVSLTENCVFGISDGYPTIDKCETVSLDEALQRLHHNRTIVICLSGDRMAYIRKDTITVYGSDYHADDIKRIYQAHEELQNSD